MMRYKGREGERERERERRRETRIGDPDIRLSHLCFDMRSLLPAIAPRAFCENRELFLNYRIHESVLMLRRKRSDKDSVVVGHLFYRDELKGGS